jgi:hypothetical protein
MKSKFYLWSILLSFTGIVILNDNFPVLAQRSYTGFSGDYGLPPSRLDQGAHRFRVNEPIDSEVESNGNHRSDGF